MRFSAGLFVLAVAGVASAEEPKAKVEAKDKPQPAAADLRYGHWLISARGGLWLPSAKLVPTGPGLDALRPGGDAGLRIGVGLSGWVVLFAEAGIGRAIGGSSCFTCAATSVDAGLGVSAHLTQGFAVDPWLSYGAGYRHTFLTVDDVPGATAAAVPAFDFTKLYLGLDYYPVPVFGFGPYLGTDVGVRSFASPVVYADFQLGVRVTFDPVRHGTKLALSAKR